MSFSLLGRPLLLPVEIGGHKHTLLGACPDLRRQIVFKAEVSAASCDRREMPQSTKSFPVLRRTSHRHTVLPLRNLRRRIV